jgi:hypothetical protein
MFAYGVPDLPELEQEQLIEKTREEAYRLFEENQSAGRTCSPQDEWFAAWTNVTRRHAQR